MSVSVCKVACWMVDSMTACNAIIGRDDKRIKLLHKNHFVVRFSAAMNTQKLSLIYICPIYHQLNPFAALTLYAFWWIRFLLLLKMSLILLTNMHPKENWIWSLFSYYSITFAIVHCIHICASIRIYIFVYFILCRKKREMWKN